MRVELAFLALAEELAPKKQKRSSPDGPKEERQRRLLLSRWCDRRRLLLRQLRLRLRLRGGLRLDGNSGSRLCNLLLGGVLHLRRRCRLSWWLRHCYMCSLLREARAARWRLRGRVRGAVQRAAEKLAGERTTRNFRSAGRHRGSATASCRGPQRRVREDQLACRDGSASGRQDRSGAQRELQLLSGPAAGRRARLSPVRGVKA